jgi:hypothetical protein
MSHSSSDFQGKQSQEMHDAMKLLLGEYPDGKLNKDDEGAVAMAVSVDSHRVRLEFPKPVKWIACTADEAAELAMTIMYHARKLGLTKPVKIEL